MNETDNGELIKRIAGLQNIDEYREQNWSGSFEDYLDLVRENPEITRTAFKRLYDMVVGYGTEEYIDNKKRITRYRFFEHDSVGGKDAIYGLDIPLMRFVNVLKAAAEGYGPEKRVLLLHGPVGSSKSTIVRLLKKGFERYTRTAQGAMYTYTWHRPNHTEEVMPCPMHEEPLRLIPVEWRAKAIEDLGLSNDTFDVVVEGDLCPACRFTFNELMKEHDGDWSKVMNH
ncbi:MAG: serine protein kinase, partial [Proteobacteria bacterium]|nr:serine protein kinase [Pseudomonadota bacterium]